MFLSHLEHYDNARAYEQALHNTFSETEDTGTVLSQTEHITGVHDDRVSYGFDEEEPPDFDCQNSDEVLPFPHGPDLCPICKLLVSAPKVRTRELEASLALAQKLRSTQTISWSSFFSWNSTGQCRTTRIYVLRDNGRVRVRRRPWGVAC